VGLTDLQSTHGLFVRVSKTALADKAEFLVGNGRYRFDANQQGRDATVDHIPSAAVPGETQGWAAHYTTQVANLFEIETCDGCVEGFGRPESM
jgi:hypothetical protein